MKVLIDKYVIFKIILFIVLITALSYNSITNILVVEAEPVGIIDVMMISTTNLNKYFKEHEILANVLLIIYSGMLDASVLLLSYNWIMHSKSYRPLVTLFLFISLKMILQEIFIMKDPNGIIFRDPGVPSLVIDYSNFNYFYSGSIGLNLICFIELYDNMFTRIFTGCSLLISIVITICLRINYTICIIASLVAAHYFHLLSEKYSHYLDKIYTLEHPGEGRPIIELTNMKDIKYNPI